ncbi:hypothetical protein P8452_50127 [Trifolium repens]|nr:hypothetical protein P8452_50127 [Trifolium repens]
MILLDERLDRIHATIRKHLISKFKDQIKEGKAYNFERFMVAKNDPTFQVTPHKHKLNFMRGTKVFTVHAPEIPMNHFEFMPFPEILASTKEDRYLDVIGHVVEKTAMKETQKNGKINKVMDATLEDLEGNRVHCTLWDEFAFKMQQFLDTHDPALPVVIIFQLCKLKKYLGFMGISNSFHGSKLYLNADLAEATNYIERMNASNVELTQGVSQMTGPTVISIADDLLQTPRMTIEDLIEATEKCHGSVLAWTCEFATDAGWFYQACTKCSSRISFLGGQLYCEKCRLPRTAIPKYKVHLEVIDNTGSITFVLFDRVVAQVIGRTAQDLLDSINNEDHRDKPFPTQLDVFVNKRVLFKVEVTDANLYRNWRGYTVKKLSDEEDIINRFTELHGINLSGDNEYGLDVGGTDALNTLADTSLEIIEGVDSSVNEGIVAVDGTHTPSSKVIGEKDAGSSDAGGSATKKLFVNIEDDNLANTMDAPSTRSAVKRSANSNEVEVAAPKEVKMACVKNSNVK